MASRSFIYTAGPTNGYGACTICQHYAAKVTVIMVLMSVSNLDVMDLFCDIINNLEMTICPCPIVKVTVIIMVTSSGNPDVMSHL